MKKAGGILFLLLVVAMQGCPQPAFDPMLPRHVRELECLEVRVNDSFKGWARKQEIVGPEQGQYFWRVENAAGQWVGWIDANGRVFRCLPHREKADHVATCSLAAGVKVLLRLSQKPNLGLEK